MELISPAYFVFHLDSVTGTIFPHSRPIQGLRPVLRPIIRTVFGLVNGICLKHECEKSCFSFLPPLPEQAAIVRYLDYVDRRIRRYVAAKERLILLLEEEKQAVINRAVTRGLDPNVPLKPSGTEWLGDVPAHWERRRLKRSLLHRLIDLRTQDRPCRQCEFVPGRAHLCTLRGGISRQLRVRTACFGRGVR